ncbi:ciliary-associated calcium-binding coiled-coil protein 1-like [Salvelinus fontinalis]|uniref:ciliary-associated calcium-binding coiled-coil protein 1-like n=1 Tax=Salvelinus fontinalis TaxID=8038 RepID=UPI002485B985|nr:ciliary-associated calcium-binding coiled-coil protein 1-like [Salvelinus fontinalis]
MSAKAKQSNKSADKNANDRNDAASKDNDAEKANPQWKLISHEQINTLLDLTVEQVQLQFEEILGLKNYQTCLKEAALLDYFVSGFWWAREMNYTCQQISFIMALLQVLLDNIREKQMPFVDNLNEFAKLMSGTRQSPSPEVDSLFDAEHAVCITDYLKCSLFQNYQLYEFLFNQPREELLLGEKRTIEVISSADCGAPLEEGMNTEDYLHYMTPVDQQEEGQRSSQEEDGEGPAETGLQQEKENKATEFEGFNVQDVKDLTNEMLGDLQAEFTEKLRVQEETFRTRLDPLKQSACK